MDMLLFSLPIKPNTEGVYGVCSWPGNLLNCSLSFFLLISFTLVSLYFEAGTLFLIFFEYWKVDSVRTNIMNFVLDGFKIRMSLDLASGFV